MAIIVKLWRLKIISSVRVMMRVENNNVSGQNHDPEQIDLIDLLVQLWRGKMTIIISVIVAIAHGYRVSGRCQRKVDFHSYRYST